MSPKTKLRISILTSNGAHDAEKMMKLSAQDAQEVLQSSPGEPKFSARRKAVHAAALSAQLRRADRNRSRSTGRNASARRRRTAAASGDRFGACSQRGAARSIFMFAGQACIGSSRFYVERPIYEEFVKRFSQVASKVGMGDLRDPNTVIAPIISERQRDRIKP